MSNTNTGGPAFPYEYFDKQLNQNRIAVGMTLRDYFAAKAMPAVLTELWQQGEHESPIPPLAANFSYEVADAMLKAREA